MVCAAASWAVGHPRSFPGKKRSRDMHRQTHWKTHRGAFVYTYTLSQMHAQVASHTPSSSQELSCFDRSSFTTAWGYQHHHLPPTHHTLSALPPHFSLLRTHPASFCLPRCLSFHFCPSLEQLLLSCKHRLLSFAGEILTMLFSSNEFIFLPLIQSQSALSEQFMNTLLYCQDRIKKETDYHDSL